MALSTLRALLLELNCCIKGKQLEPLSSLNNSMSSWRDEIPVDQFSRNEVHTNGAAEDDDGIGEPTCNDVLLGRGVTTNRHVGNVVSMHDFLIP